MDHISPALTLDPAPFHWVGTILSFMRRRWRQILKTVCAFVGAAIVYLLITPPIFSSTASVLVDSRRADPFHQAPVADSQYENALVDSQVEVLQSQGIALRVAADLRLRDDKLFNGPPPNIVKRALSGFFGLFRSSSQPPNTHQRDLMAAESLMKELTVNRVGLSYVIQVSASTLDADLSAKLANAVVTSYINEQLEANYDVTRNASAWLQDRLSELRKQSIDADRAVQVQKVQGGIVDTEKGVIDEHELADLSTQLSAARGRTADAAAKLAQIQHLKETNYDSAAVSDALASATISKLRQDYLDAQQREVELSAKYGSNHGVVRDLRKHMADIRSSIRDEMDRILNAYQSDYAVARSGEAGLEARLAQLVKSSAGTNERRVESRALESRADTYRALYSTFLQRYTQAAQDQSFPITEARVVTRAEPALRKSKPKGTLILLASAVLGLGAGVAWAFLRETLDNKLRTPAQIRSTIGRDCLAILPQMAASPLALLGPETGASDSRELVASRMLLPGDTILRLVVQQPMSEYSEAVRRIWARVLQQRAAGRRIQVIGCTSAIAGEGKSTVAANLAQIFAQAGTRTLLIDGDLRKPFLSYQMVGRRTAGLFDVVHDGVPLEGVIWKDSTTGLHFLPAAAGNVLQPAELLGSPQLRDLLAQLRKAYDCIVFDLPPLDKVADTHVAANLIDSFALVVEWGQTDKNVVADAAKSLETGKDRLLGIVFNKADLKAVRDLADRQPAPPALWRAA